MGRVCDCCGRERANERFGGRGQRARICSDCRCLPKAELQLHLAHGEIFHFLEQRNISQKNIARLRALETINDPTFQNLRLLILEIALLAPRKRGRWNVIAANHRDILERAIAAGLTEHIYEHEELDLMDDINRSSSIDE